MKILRIVIAIALIVTAPAWVRFGKMDIVKEWKQPSTIEYGTDYKIKVRVLKYKAFIDIFDQYSSYYVYVGSGGYGYLKEYGLSDYSQNIKESLSMFNINWERNSIKLIEPSGVVLELPTKLFITLN